MHCTVLTLAYLWCCNQQSSRNLTTIPPFAGLTDLTYDLSLSRLGIVTLTGFPLLKAVPNFMQIAVREFPHVVRYCNQQSSLANALCACTVQPKPLQARRLQLAGLHQYLPACGIPLPPSHALTVCRHQKNTQVSSNSHHGTTGQRCAAPVCRFRGPHQRHQVQRCGSPSPPLRPAPSTALVSHSSAYIVQDNSVLRDYHGLCQTFKSPVIVNLVPPTTPDFFLLLFPPANSIFILFIFQMLPEQIRPVGCNATIRAWPLKTACASLCSCLRCFPPDLVSAQFRSTGRAVDVTFSAATNQAGLFSTSCSAIWSNAIDLFGASAFPPSQSPLTPSQP